ncbi:hypothetical protein I3842_07G054300 [Carya illinoinensis]|uniref:RNase H type-1 domain-containing protein n=1 Tax=Carya illinoinensis TaxID=32201 RepID=A0A922EFN4_CARIL|nr:hypothetical protein I3842_07G054300 [Carya illinoinensis]
MDREETRLAHMAKKSWLKDGDQNSKFFHAYLNAKYHQRVQDMHLSDGTSLHTPLDIHQAAVDYFDQFLGHNYSCVLPNLSELISPIVSNKDNLAIGRAPSLEEIKDALFTIPIDSSPGPDGFGSGFFRVCWDFVKDDVFEAIVEFFHTHMLPKSYTASYIVLIPKVDKPSGFDKFRPISLCFVIYKICTKIIVTQQGAFIPGRSIFENFSLTQEMVHSIHRKSIGAYDCMDWNFILHVLMHFGFSPNVCDLVKACISSPWYSVMMNGTPLGFFKGARGLRQEVLSCLLKKSFEEGTPIISHLIKKSMRGLMEVLNTSKVWTGQRIPLSRKNALLNLTGFSEGCFPFKYLGVPIVNGRLKASDFSELLGKVKKKIASWKMKMLSAGGRTILLRHVLSNVPKVVFLNLNKILSSFFGGDSKGKGCRKWISWKHICTPIDEALHMKLAWRLIKGKYVKGQHLSILDSTKGTRFWRSIVRNIPTVLNNSKWIVKEGNISFCQFLVIDHPSIKIKECRIENGCDISLLTRLVGHHKASELYDFLARRKEGQDVLVWLKDKDGHFTTKSAWDYGGYSDGLKCNCCQEGHTEDLNHVLCTGEFARHVWRLAASHLGVHMASFYTWTEQINFWFRRASKSSQVRIIFGILPSIISWKLWERRCKARYEEKANTVESVWHAIKLWLRRVVDQVMKVSSVSTRDIDILNRLDIPVLNPKPKRVRVVRWTRPRQGWVKLNIDGSSLGNLGHSGAGGVIRDDNGRLIVAYSVSLGHGTNNFAEFQSLLEGVRRCHTLGFSRVQIETDSQLLVNWITKDACPNWYLEDFWEELHAFRTCMDYTVTHIFREGAPLVHGALTFS